MCLMDAWGVTWACDTCFSRPFWRLPPATGTDRRGFGIIAIGQLAGDRPTLPLSGATAAPLDRAEQRLLAAFARGYPRANAIP